MRPQVLPLVLPPSTYQTLKRDASDQAAYLIAEGHRRHRKAANVDQAAEVSTCGSGGAAIRLAAGV